MRKKQTGERIARFDSGVIDEGATADHFRVSAFPEIVGRRNSYPHAADTSLAGWNDCTKLPTRAIAGGRLRWQEKPVVLDTLFANVFSSFDPTPSNSLPHTLAPPPSISPTRTVTAITRRLE